MISHGILVIAFWEDPNDIISLRINKANDFFKALFSIWSTPALHTIF